MSPSEIFVWNETQSKLKALVFRYTRDKAATDDIVQEVFLKAYSKLGQLRDRDKMAHWMFRVTRNAITDHFRSLSRTVPAEALDWETDHKVLNECVEECLVTMMKTLPEKYREALELAELESLSQTDLALKLNISYSGAKSRVQRARQMLKDKMESAYKIELDSYGNVVVCEDRIPCACPASGPESTQ